MVHGAQFAELTCWARLSICSDDNEHVLLVSGVDGTGNTHFIVGSSMESIYRVYGPINLSFDNDKFKGGAIYESVK